MSNKPFIRKYVISGLFGYKDFELSFNDNIKILIGENGYGKTTVLNSLAFLLKKKYKNLSRIKFSEIKIDFDDSHIYEFSSNDLKSYIEYLNKQRDREDGIVSYIKGSLDQLSINQLINIAKTNEKDFVEAIKNTENLNGLPARFVYQALLELSERETKYKVFTDLETYINSTGYKILYYPTYRRVEVDLKNIIDGFNESRRYGRIQQEQNEILGANSIIKFGMDDVEDSRRKICKEISKSSISGFAAVSGGMISKLLDSEFSNNVIHKFDINEIKIVLSRVGENMSQKDKDSILSQIEEDPSLNQQSPYLKYFLDQLLTVYKKQEKYDTAIKQFVSTCNKYLSEKEFTYDESTVSLLLQRKGLQSKEELYLSQLSSGEKQIVSIFSQIYLEPDKKYVVLFDEPELSLSIYWQEKLLPDMLNSGRCVFMLAVTHSPFIFNNELKTNVVGLKEFKKNGTEE